MTKQGVNNYIITLEVGQETNINKIVPFVLLDIDRIILYIQLYVIYNLLTTGVNNYIITLVVSQEENINIIVPFTL